MFVSGHSACTSETSGFLIMLLEIFPLDIEGISDGIVYGMIKITHQKQHIAVA